MIASWLCDPEEKKDTRQSYILTCDKNESGHGAFSTAPAGFKWLFIPSECLLIKRVSKRTVFN